MLLCALMLPLLVAEGRGPHHPRGEVVKHVHYRPTKSLDSPGRLMEDSQLLHDIEHLQEHLEDVVEPDLTKMSDEELEFYYFQVHDTDKNSKLDGLEILQAILHTTHHYDKKSDDFPEDVDGNQVQEIEDDFAYYVDLIDHALEEDDLDNDGLLSYPEYASGRKRAAIIEKNNKIY